MRMTNVYDLKRTHTTEGAILDPFVVIEECLKIEHYRDNDGFAWVQILGDAHQAKKPFSLVNVAVRPLNVGGWNRTYSDLQNM